MSLFEIEPKSTGIDVDVSGKKSTRKLAKEIFLFSAGCLLFISMIGTLIFLVADAEREYSSPGVITFEIMIEGSESSDVRVYIWGHTSPPIISDSFVARESHITLTYFVPADAINVTVFIPTTSIACKVIWEPEEGERTEYTQNDAWESVTVPKCDWIRDNPNGD